MLSPSGEQLKQGRKVAAAKIKNGDILTFVIISRDPRAEDWIARATLAKTWRTDVVEGEIWMNYVEDVV